MSDKHLKTTDITTKPVREQSLVNATTVNLHVVLVDFITEVIPIAVCAQTTPSSSFVGNLDLYLMSLQPAQRECKITKGYATIDPKTQGGRKGGPPTLARKVGSLFCYIIWLILVQSVIYLI
jgi:hypothetical protein